MGEFGGKPRIQLEIGDTFGHWTVVAEHEPIPVGFKRVRMMTAYVCQCGKCNREFAVQANNLTHGRSTQCFECSHRDVCARNRKYLDSFGGLIPRPDGKGTYTLAETLKLRQSQTSVQPDKTDGFLPSGDKDERRAD